MYRDTLFFEDMIGQNLSEYILTECYFLVIQSHNPSSRMQSWTMVINSNNQPLYCLDLNSIEFVKRIYSYRCKGIITDEIYVRKRLVLIHKESGIGFFLCRNASKIQVYYQKKVMEMIEFQEDPFRWEKVENL